jgi:hypothetical protein
VACLAIVGLTSCAGSSDDASDDASDGGAGVRIDDQVVIDPAQVAAAREQAEGDAAPVTVADTASTPPSSAVDSAESTTTLPVAEAEVDELDSLLNALTVFNSCLAGDGFEYIGAPGIGGATGEQFDEPYLQALGKCATASNVVEALQGFGSALDERTPEEIAEYNFGLPVFRECMIARGWTVGELVPDERGALGFGTALEPPPGTDGFGTDDVADCRLDAEQHVADEYVADADAGADDGAGSG